MRIIISVSLLILFGKLRGFACQEATYTEEPFASLSYTAVVKGKAALPCHVKSAIPDDSVSLILWYKDDALTPIYTMDARKGTIEQARTLTESSLQGRAFFNLNNRPAFLQIDPVQLSDASDYRCRVDFRKARTINTVVSLKVIVPPEEPQIALNTGEKKVGLKGLIGPFNEGGSLKLTCTTSGGKPRPTLTWWRDSSLIDDSFEYIDKEVTTNQLTIPSLARHHLLAKLTCQAVNNNMTIPLSSSVTLELNLKPTEVHIRQVSPILVANKKATFECKAIGSRPKPNLFWIFEGKRHTLPVTGDQVFTSQITLEIKKEHNKAKLICIAENPQVVDSAISSQHQLDVQYSPQVIMGLGSLTVSLQPIQEGNDVYFDCKIDANPPPSKPIIWKHNGKKLNPQPGVILSNQTLVLQKVSRFQRGRYQCIAKNSQGSTISNELDVDIRFAPVCKYSGELVYGVSVHEAVILRCELLANPDNVSFMWKFQDLGESIPGSSQSRDRRSELKYIVNSDQDYGTVQCSGKNDVGIQRNSCKFRIKPKEPPDFPYNCRISNQSDNALVVLCFFDAQLNHSGNDIFTSLQVNSQLEEEKNSLDALKMLPSLYVYPITYYFAEVYTKTDSLLMSNVSTFLNLSSIFASFASTSFPQPTSYTRPSSQMPEKFMSSSLRDFEFFITDLQPSTTFRIKLYAANTQGRSEERWLEGSTLRSAEKLVDSMADSSLGRQLHVDTPEDGAIRGPKFLLVMLVSGVTAVFLIIFLGIVAIFRLRQNILRHSSGGSSSSSLSSSTRDRNPSKQEVLTTLSHQTGTTGSGGNDVFRSEDDDEECCCDNDSPAQVLLSSNANQQQHANHSNKGPPDIIPSFGYCIVADGDKQYLSYDYSGHPENQQSSAQQYAQLAFSIEPSTVKIGYNGGPERVEYAKIEFQKASRVNVIASGSPKFESTV